MSMYNFNGEKVESDLGNDLHNVSILTNDSRTNFICLDHASSIPSEKALQEHLRKHRVAPQGSIPCRTCQSELGTADYLHLNGNIHRNAVSRRSWSACMDCMAVVAPGATHCNSHTLVEMHEIRERCGIESEVDVASQDMVQKANKSVEIGNSKIRSTSNNKLEKRVAAFIAQGKFRERSSKKLVESPPICDIHFEAVLGIKPNVDIPGCSKVNEPYSICRICKGISHLLRLESNTQTQESTDTKIITEVSRLKAIDQNTAYEGENADILPESIPIAGIAHFKKKRGGDIIDRCYTFSSTGLQLKPDILAAQEQAKQRLDDDYETDSDQDSDGSDVEQENDEGEEELPTGNDFQENEPAAESAFTGDTDDTNADEATVTVETDTGASASTSEDTTPDSPMDELDGRKVVGQKNIKSSRIATPVKKPPPPPLVKFCPKHKKALKDGHCGNRTCQYSKGKGVVVPGSV